MNCTFTRVPAMRLGVKQANDDNTSFIAIRMLRYLTHALRLGKLNLTSSGAIYMYRKSTSRVQLDMSDMYHRACIQPF
jgi:hypothetical protein